MGSLWLESREDDLRPISILDVNSHDESESISTDRIVAWLLPPLLDSLSYVPLACQASRLDDVMGTRRDSQLRMNGQGTDRGVSMTLNGRYSHQHGTVRTIIVVVRVEHLGDSIVDLLVLWRELRRFMEERTVRSAPGLGGRKSRDGSQEDVRDDRKEGTHRPWTWSGQA